MPPAGDLDAGLLRAMDTARKGRLTLRDWLRLLEAPPQAGPVASRGDNGMEMGWASRHGWPRMSCAGCAKSHV